MMTTTLEPAAQPTVGQVQAVGDVAVSAASSMSSVMLSLIRKRADSEIDAVFERVRHVRDKLAVACPQGVMDLIIEANEAAGVRDRPVFNGGRFASYHDAIYAVYQHLAWIDVHVAVTIEDDKASPTFGPWPSRQHRISERVTRCPISDHLLQAKILVLQERGRAVAYARTRTIDHSQGEQEGRIVPANDSPENRAKRRPGWNIENWKEPEEPTRKATLKEMMAWYDVGSTDSIKRMADKDTIALECCSRQQYVGCVKDVNRLNPSAVENCYQRD